LRQQQFISQTENPEQSIAIGYKLFHAGNQKSDSGIAYFERYNIFSDELNIVKNESNQTSNHSLSFEPNKLKKKYTPQYKTHSTQAEISPQKTIILTPRDRYSADWILIFLIAALGFIVIIRQTKSGFFTKLFNSVLSFATFGQNYTEHKKNPSLVFIWFSIITILSWAIFLYQNKYLFGIEQSYDFISSVVGLSGLILLFNIGKRLISYMLAELFNLIEINSMYNFAGHTQTALSSFILMVGIFAIAYSPFPEIVSFSVFTLLFILYLLKIFRLVKINLKSNTKILYIFLYLCALEILPFSVAFRIVNEFVIK